MGRQRASATLPSCDEYRRSLRGEGEPREWGSIIAGSVLTAGNKMVLVSSGGDTDTNGALTNAVLGTRYGAGAIPIC